MYLKKKFENAIMHVTPSTLNIIFYLTQLIIENEASIFAS